MRTVSVACVLMAVAGCTDSYSVVITKNAPSKTDCQANISATTDLLSRGALDVTSPLPDGTLNPGYYLTPVAQSGIRDSTGNVGNPNSHIAFVQGAEIEILSDGTQSSDRAVSALQSAGLAKRTERFTVVIMPNDLAGFVYPVIDARQVAILNSVLAGGELTAVVTRSKLFGTLDSGDFDSLPYDYPVTLCRGCLIQNLGRCDQYPMTMEFKTGGVCGPLQDDVLSCCLSTGAATLCPAVGQMAETP